MLTARFKWNHRSITQKRQGLQQQWCLQGLLLEQLKYVGKTEEVFSWYTRSSESSFSKAHLFLSGTAAGLIKTITRTSCFASILRASQMPEAMPIFNVASAGEWQGKQAARPVAFSSRRSFQENLVLVRESAAKEQWIVRKAWCSLYEQEN